MKRDLRASIDYVSRHFEYKKDPSRIDAWKVMRYKDGKYKGDCEDFALTVLWYYFGENLFKFILNVFILHRVGIYYAKTKNGRGHAVCRVGDLWFDNFTREALPKSVFFAKTGHKIKLRYFLPYMILQPIIGLFLR